MARDETKAVGLAAGAGLVGWGVQLSTTGSLVTGVIAAIFGLAVMVGYQFAESNDHTQVYNDVVDAIGEDTLRRLAEMTGDELEDAIDDAR